MITFKVFRPLLHSAKLGRTCPHPAALCGRTFNQKNKYGSKCLKLPNSSRNTIKKFRVQPHQVRTAQCGRTVRKKCRRLWCLILNVFLEYNIIIRKSDFSPSSSNHGAIYQMLYFVQNPIFITTAQSNMHLM